MWYPCGHIIKPIISSQVQAQGSFPSPWLLYLRGTDSCSKGEHCILNPGPAVHSIVWQGQECWSKQHGTISLNRWWITSPCSRHTNPDHVDIQLAFTITKYVYFSISHHVCLFKSFHKGHWIWFEDWSKALGWHERGKGKGRGLTLPKICPRWADHTFLSKWGVFFQWVSNLVKIKMNFLFDLIEILQSLGCYDCPDKCDARDIPATLCI